MISSDNFNIKQTSNLTNRGQVAMGIIQPCKSQQLFRLYPEYHLEQSPQQNPYELTILSRDRTLYVIKQGEQPPPKIQQIKRVLKIAGQQKIQDKIYTLFEWSNRSLQDLRQERVLQNKYLNPQQMLFFLQQIVAAYTELYNQEINNRNNPNKQLCIKAINIKLFKNDKAIKVVPPYIGNYKANEDPEYKPLGMNDISILGLIFLDLGLLHQVRDIYAKPQRLQGYLKAFQKRYGLPLAQLIKRMIQGASWQEINRTLNKGLNTSDNNSIWSGNSGNNNIWRMPQGQVNQTITYIANGNGQLLGANHNHFGKEKENSYYPNSITEYETIEKQRAGKQMSKKNQNSKRSVVRQQKRSLTKQSKKNEQQRNSRVLILKDPSQQKQISATFKIQSKKNEQNPIVTAKQVQNRQRRVSFTYNNQEKQEKSGNDIRLVRQYSPSPSFNGQQNKQLSKVVSHPMLLPNQNPAFERKFNGPSGLPHQNRHQFPINLPPNVPPNAHGIHRCEKSPSKILSINQDQNIIFQPSAKDVIILQPLQGVPKELYSRKTKPDYQVQQKQETQSFVPNFIKQKQNSNPKKKPQNKPKKEENSQKQPLNLFTFKQKKDQKNFQELRNYYYSNKNTKEDSDSLSHQFWASQRMGIKSKQVIDLPLISKTLIPDPNEARTQYKGDYHPVYRNMKHGKGVMRFSDGKVYKGNWVSNKMQGYGQLYTKSGKLIYRGYWSQNKLDGQGVLINYEAQYFPSNTKSSSLAQNFDDLMPFWQSYQGDFMKGVWHGTGTLKLTNGDILRGLFNAGRVHGNGVYMNKYGEKIEATWHQGVLKQKKYPFF